MNLDWQLVQNCKLILTSVFKNTFKTYQQKKAAKLLLSDQSKTLQIYDLSKQLINEYKSQTQDKVITSTCLSDQLIFFNVGGQIKAINRKGKQIYSFQTYMAETVKNILVFGFKLWVIGDSLINQFEMCESNLVNNKSRKSPPTGQKTKQSSYYMSEDQILDSKLYVQNGTGYCLILRKNNQIQIIDKNEILAFFKTDSPPNCCNYYNNKEPSQNIQRYLIGLISGFILCVEVSVKNKKRLFTKLWSIQQVGNKINSICEFPKGILVNRSSQLEIWTGGQYDEKRGLISSFELGWRKQTTEAIIQILYIQSNDEIIYASFTGKVYSLVNYQKQIEKSKINKKEAQTKNAILGLKKDIEKLQNQKKQLKSKEIVKMGNKIQKYKFSYNLNLNPSTFGYNLQISCSLPITTLIFNGNIKIKTEKQILYEGESSVYKIQNYVIKLQNQNNINLQLYSTQGNSQTINCFVHLKGDKQLVNSFNIQIKPLCLHYKIDNKIPKQLKNRNDLNKLTIEGRFTKIDVHSWISYIFPQTSKTLSEDQVIIAYESIITKQKITCEYKQSFIQFLSQSINPLIIIRKSIYKKSKQREISINFKMEPNKLSIQNSLKAIQKRILEYEKIQKQFNILPGLIELKTQQQDRDKFSQQFQAILDNQQKIKSRYKEVKKQYEDLKLSVFELYKSFQQSKQKDITQFEKENFLKKLSNFKLQQIKNFILN